MSTPSVGVIGLGAMGGRMAGRIARNRLLTRVYDVDLARAAPFGEAMASSPDEVFRTSTLVLLSLPGAAQARSVLEPLCDVPRPPVTVLDTTTRSPEQATQLADLLAAAGHRYLDAPVSGGTPAAEQGALRVMIGGDADTLALARPTLEAISGDNYVHVGPVGAGSACKLMNNVLYAANLMTVGEAVRVAAAHGVAPAAFVEALNGASGRSLASELVYPRFILSGTFDTEFAIGLMRRDIDLAAASVPDDIPTPALELVRELWAASAQWLTDQEDTTRIYDVLPAVAASHWSEAPL